MLLIHRCAPRRPPHPVSERQLQQSRSASLSCHDVSTVCRPSRCLAKNKIHVSRPRRAALGDYTSNSPPSHIIQSSNHLSISCASPDLAPRSSSAAAAHRIINNVRLAESLAGALTAPPRSGCSLLRGSPLMLHRSCKAQHRHS